MKKKHVVCIVTTAYQSVVTILDSKLRILSSQPDFEVIVASSGKDREETRIPAVPFFPIPIPRTIRPLRDMVAVAKILLLLKKQKVALIHTHTAKAGFVGAIAGKIYGIPVFHSYHGLPFFKGQRRSAYQLYRFLEVAISRFRTCLLSQNQSDFDTLKSIRSIRCPVFFEGNGIDAERIQNNSVSDTRFVESFYRPDSVKIACIARLEPVKHLSKMINAIEAIRDSQRRVHCIIAGKGPLRLWLDRYILEKNLQGTISILYTPFIHALIGLSDIVALSSEKEGIPRSLMEAMALKKPVVATDVLGTNELVQNGKTGLLVPFHDQDALNSALIRLVDDPALRKRLGDAGYHRIIEKFDEKKIVSFWSERYKSSLGCYA
jgi:glycosyltransferase involved in cell wall biosynthesis